MDKVRQVGVRLFLITGMLLSKPVLAQVYEPAFIFSIFGDTIRCQLKYVSFVTSKTEFRYKKSLEDKHDLFINAKDVLWIVTRKDTFECLAIDKGLYKGQVYAYKLLVNGHLRLYSQDRYLKKMNEVSVALFIKKEGELLQEIDVLDYKKYLTAYTEDHLSEKSKIAALPYQQESLMLFVKEYNDWYTTKEK